ncbi:MAG: hypothetical protein K2Y37_26150 [Pirellulales bacterium]|nr:hypothetical protein [Pirellulales bacterium]
MRYLAPRRWFQFRLSTWFVLVTGASVWLASQIRVIQERREILNWIIEQGGVYNTWLLEPDTPQSYAPADWYAERDEQTSRIRTWLGDNAVAFINLYQPMCSESLRDVRRFFPEAEVWCVNETLATRAQSGGGGFRPPPGPRAPIRYSANLHSRSNRIVLLALVAFLAWKAAWAVGERRRRQSAHATPLGRASN